MEETLRMLDPYGLPTLFIQSIPGQVPLSNVAVPNFVNELETPMIPFRRPAVLEVLDEAEVAAAAADVALDLAVVTAGSAATMGELAAAVEVAAGAAVLAPSS
jgi:hypothetical protein